MSDPLTSLARLGVLCREQRLPLTAQRRAILEVLVDRSDHPTADQLWAGVKRRLPGISRTTVYRVLETLVRLGIARMVSHPGAAARFEARTERHHHLVCSDCGAMTDLDAPHLDGLRPPDVQRSGFRITDWSVHFTGRCARCQRTARPHRKPVRKENRA